MRSIFIFLLVLFFSGFSYQESTAQRYVRLDFNAATGGRKFYTIINKKAMPLSISANDPLPPATTHLIFSISNLRPTKFQYISWGFENDQDLERKFKLHQLGDDLMGGVLDKMNSSSNLFEAFFDGVDSRGPTSVNDIYQNLDAIQKLERTEVENQVNSNFFQFQELKELGFEFSALGLMDNLSVETLRDLVEKKLEGKVIVPYLKSEKSKNEYIESLSIKFKISKFALDEIVLLDSSATTMVETRGAEKSNNLKQKFFDEIRASNLIELNSFYEEPKNLEKSIEALQSIFEFRRNLYNGSYFYTDTIELDRTANKLTIHGIKTNFQNKNSDGFALDESEFDISEFQKEILSVKLPEAPRLAFYYSFGLKYSVYLSANRNYRLENYGLDSLVVRAYDSEQFFPVIDQSFSFIYDRGNSFSLGASLFVGFPLFDQARPTFGFGPSLAIGRGVNKFFLNASIGFAHQNILSSEVTVNYPFENDFSDMDDYIVGSYQPTISFGIGIGLGGGK